MYGSPNAHWNVGYFQMGGGGGFGCAIFKRTQCPAARGTLLYLFPAIWVAASRMETERHVRIENGIGHDTHTTPVEGGEGGGGGGGNVGQREVK
jgi:hypothetical protein